MTSIQDSDAERRAASERAAKRRFPEMSTIIDELLKKDENFCQMCEELADIDRAISEADVMPLRHSEQAVFEWKPWSLRLTAEIEEALYRANVIPMKPCKQYPRL